MMAAVFSMQGAGQFAAAMVALMTTIGFRKSFSSATSFSTCQDSCQLAADRAWRIIIGLGAVPALFALYYRITIPETPRFTFDVAHDIEQADADIKAYMEGKADGRPDAIRREETKLVSSATYSQPRASWSDFYIYFSNWRNGSALLATMASWFFVDFAFYGLGLNNATVLAAIGYSSGSSVYQILYNVAVGNLILVCAGAIPGYWLSVLTVDYFGRKTIQIGGFVILTIIFCIIGFGYNSLNQAALLALYILAQFFFNFGPNTTTFIIPGECFPTRYRSTGHGLSAASGKLGATIAQVIAQPLLTKGAAADCKGSTCSPWLDHLMEIFACFMLCGTVVSFLIPETKRKTLEVLAGEAPLSIEGSSNSMPRRKRGFLFRILGWIRLIHYPISKVDGERQTDLHESNIARWNENNRSEGGSQTVIASSEYDQTWGGTSQGNLRMENMLLRDMGNLLK
jgi:PHS family inorganic phosphate transporter-like MFS transporter